ncbi:hypothetical protein BGZ49_008579, partial [Haplosporangium sp. Z 27]
STAKSDPFKQSDYRNSSYDRRLDQNQGYRNRHQLLEDVDDEDDDEGDDIDDYEDEDQLGYHSAYNTAHNSAYNSCDESDDVNMEGVSIKEEQRDLDMAEPPSSSASSSSSSARFPTAPSHGFQSHYPQSQPQQQQQQHHHSFQPQRQQQNQDLPSSSNTTPSSFSPSASSKSTPSVQTPQAIKPRPALRPLLPSRPTSPQPLNLSRQNQSSEIDSSKDKSSSSTNSKSSSSGKTRQSAYKINGLNILNRNSLDSRTALEMIRRRRENHNHVERRRRDTLNSTILQIAEILPNCSSTAKLNKGTILRLALDHLRALHTENHSLRSENAALRFFYQGSQMRRNGPPGPTGTSSNFGQPHSGPTQSQNSHSIARGSGSSGMSTPPIIPGPGQGTIPSLNGAAAAQAHFQSGNNVAMVPTPASTPASAANSPPGQHSAHLMSSPVPSPSSSHMPAANSAVNKRSQSLNGHLHPILPKSQAKASPSPSPRPRLLPHPSPNGIRPYNDAIRIGPSPLSSPCSSPPLAPMSIHHSNSNNSNILANALPTVPASHQHSAAVSAAAAVAAAAAAAAAAAGTTVSRSGSIGSSQSLMPSSSVSSSMSSRHHKSGSSGSQSSGQGSHVSLLPSVSSGPDKARKFSAHSAYSSNTSAPSSGTPSATTSPYSSPYPGPGHNQGGQGHNLSPSSHPSYQHHSSSNQHHSQQYQHHSHHHSQGSGITLPSIGTVTNPSSPMTSPHHGPFQMGALPLPTPMSLPAPAIVQDSFVKHPNSNQGIGHNSVPHSYHSHEGFPILPPLAPR